MDISYFINLKQKNNRHQLFYIFFCLLIVCFTSRYRNACQSKSDQLAGNSEKLLVSRTEQAVFVYYAVLLLLDICHFHTSQTVFNSCVWGSRSTVYGPVDSGELYFEKKNHMWCIKIYFSLFATYTILFNLVLRKIKFYYTSMKLMIQI